MQETELEMVQRHVREGEKHVATQKARIAANRRRELSTHGSEDLLRTFEITLALHRQHLARLEASVAKFLEEQLE